MKTKDLYVLGINGGVRPGYQDVSAVLMKNGEILGAIEEERLTRIKFSPGVLPLHSIHYLLEQAQVSIKDIDLVASHGMTWGEDYHKALQEFFTNHFEYCPVIERFYHHDCHAASCYYGSGFKNSLVVTMDNSGDGVSTQISLGVDGKLELIDRYQRPNSLGMFYSMFTQFCGFVRDSDEYKLMGLAPYGDPTAFDLSDILFWDGERYRFDSSYLKKVAPGQPQPSRQQLMFSQKLWDRFGRPRAPKTELTQKYKDLAACVQYQLEKVTLEMLAFYAKKYKTQHLCLAGGVALNCAMNGKIVKSELFKGLSIQPAASDSGVSLGAAYLGSIQLGDEVSSHQHCFWGRDYSDEDIEQVLLQSGLDFTKIDNIPLETATLLKQGYIVGWFQGRSEFGPRALGARSILADPRDAKVKDRVNFKIKFREGFRPFCPSALAEDSTRLFETYAQEATYMNIAFQAKERALKDVPGVVHLDQTSRLQIVDKRTNPLFHDLLEEFKKITGVGVLLNTSFNRSHEPIVETPRDAISCFYGSGLDALVIGRFILRKQS